MNCLLSPRSFRVKLHRVGFDSHDCPTTRGQQKMWNLRKHWISEVLDHQAHAMRLGPAGTEDRAGLRFASLEGHARPAQLTAQPDQPPVMRAFVQKERLAGRDAVHVDSVLLQLVWTRLLDV